MNVTFTDNSKKVEAAFNKQVKMGLAAIGVMAVNFAQQDCPVDTGRLRASISNKTEANAEYIGTNVEYAPKIEFTNMAHRVGKAHFLRDAATRHNDYYKKIMKAALKK